MARKDSVFKPCGAPNYETSGAPILGYSHPGKPFRPELNPRFLTGTYAGSYGRPVAACCNGPFSTISYTRYRSQTLPPSFTSALSRVKLTARSVDSPSFAAKRAGASVEPSAQGAMTTLISSHIPA